MAIFSTLKQMVVLLLVLILLASCPVLAASGNDEENVIVKSGETVKGLKFYKGRSIIIDGTVDGTVFAAAQEITVNGFINGDLFAAAQYITINGKVSGNVYSASQNLAVAGQVTKDIFAGAQTIEVNKKALLERDAFLAGAFIAHKGQIQRNFEGYADNITINGLVGGDSFLEGNNIEILEEAVLKGKLTYESNIKASISPQAVVNGPVDWKKIEVAVPVKEKPSFQEKFVSFLVSLLSSLLIWFIVRLWRPAFWSRTASYIKEQPLKTPGIGTLTLLLTPILAILSLITIVGIPLGIIAGLAYGVAIYFSKIVAAVFVGFALARKFGWPELHKGVWLVLFGLVIISLLTKLPIIGIVFTLLVILAGLGSLVMVLARPTSGEGASQLA